MDTGHCFESKTFSKFTYCNYCSKFIWGVAQQGLECTGCHYRCHYDCVPKLNKRCTVNSASGDGKDTESSKKTVAEQALLRIQNRLPKKRVPPTSPSASSETQTQSDNVNHSLETVGGAMSFVETLEHAVIGAALEAHERAESNAPTSEYLASIPPLQPHTMTRNFSRFVSRCGVIFSLRDSIILLVSWDNQLNTWIAIVLYSLVCLHPELFLVIPFLALLYLALRPQAKTDEKDQPSAGKSISGDAPAPVSSASSSATKPKKTLSSTISSTTRAEKKSDPPKQPNPTDGGFGSTFNIGLSLLSSSGSESPEYRKNIQNIQQMMGEFSDGYDAVMDIWRQWMGNEDDQLLLVQFLLGAFVSASFIAYFIPVRYFCLSAGMAVFFGNTRFAKALIVLAMRNPGNSMIRKKAVSMLQQVQAIYKDHRREGNIKDEETQRIVSIFENQRYHRGEGYTGELLPKDGRSGYSNLTGSVSFSAPALTNPPKGYDWVPGSDWKVDETGPWQESYLGIEVMICSGKDGWVYTDDCWKNGKQELSEAKDPRKFPTRQRRWIRTCVPCQDEEVPVTMALSPTSDVDPFL